MLSPYRLGQRCKLKGVANRATLSYLAVLDGVMLAGLITPVATFTSPLDSQRLQPIPDPTQGSMAAAHRTIAIKVNGSERNAGLGLNEQAQLSQYAGLLRLSQELGAAPCPAKARGCRRHQQSAHPAPMYASPGHAQRQRLPP